MGCYEAAVGQGWSREDVRSHFFHNELGRICGLIVSVLVKEIRSMQLPVIASKANSIAN